MLLDVLRKFELNDHYVKSSEWPECDDSDVTNTGRRILTFQCTIQGTGKFGQAWSQMPLHEPILFDTYETQC
jgi:lactate dehydrogenase-like 2-hydroxyacid dehydrogenase